MNLGDKKAARVEWFFENHLHLSKDRYAGRPFVLEKWQRDNIIRPVFGTLDSRGRRKYSDVVIGLPRWHGKALALDTPILTAAGWSTMGDLKVGDTVYSADGSPTTITYCSPVFRDHDCFEVRFQDGQTITADADHLWTVFDCWASGGPNGDGTYIKGGWRTIDTRKMAATIAIGNRGRRESRYSVALTEPVQMPSVELPIDPYLLGVWLGDGSFYDGKITSADPEIFEAFEAAGYVLGCRDGEYTRYIKGLIVQLRELGVLRNKHIPEVYLHASAEQRLALLQGLMDTDGCACNSGRTGTSRLEFCSTKPELAYGVLFLARSLGWRVTIAESASHLYDKYCGQRWRVSWTAHKNDLLPFRLDRKASKLTTRPESGCKSRKNKVVAVTPVASVPTRCIQVDHPSHLFLAGTGLIPTHNTELAAGMLLTCAMTEPTPGGEYYIVATTKPQARIAFKAIKTMVQRDPLLAAACKPYKNVIEIPELDATIQTMAWDADTAQGFHPTVAIIDEYHVHRDASMREALLTGMVGSQNGLLITITTAGAKRSGPLWELLNERKPSSRYTYWCGATEEDDPHDPKVWRRCNPAKWITMEQLRKQYRQLPLAVFERLHLNKFSRSGVYDPAIPDDVWMSEANRRPPVLDPELACVMAVDAADKRDRTSFTVVQVDKSGDYNIWADVRASDDDRGYTDYLKLEHDIRSAADSMNVEVIGFDRRQMARTMQQLSDEGYNVAEFNQDNASMCAASQWLHDLAKAGKLRHGGDPILRSHIANAAPYERPPIGWRFAKADRNDPECKIDAAISTAMACWMAQVDHSRPPSFADSGGFHSIAL